MTRADCFTSFSFIFTFLTVLSIGHPVSAKIHVADSLEWMVVNSPLIIQGTIEELKDISQKISLQTMLFLRSAES